MNKRLLIILCYVVTFAAGTTMGLVARMPEETHKDRHPDLNEQLNLTEDQRKQMEQIWAVELRARMREIDEGRRQLYRDRSESIRKMLTPEQQAQYDEIYAETDRKLSETDALRKAAFEEARQKNRDMLTEEQRVKFDEVMAQRRSHFESRGPGGSGPGGPGSGGPGRRSSRGPDGKDKDKGGPTDGPSDKTTTPSTTTPPPADQPQP